MKKKAEKKIDLVLCKLQDLYYMGCNDKIINRLNYVVDAARRLQSAIEDESNWQKK